MDLGHGGARASSVRSRNPIDPVGADVTQSKSALSLRPPTYPTEDLNSIIPADPRQTYDMREIIARVVDGSEFREFKAEYGKTIITVSRFPL